MSTPFSTTRPPPPSTEAVANFMLEREEAQLKADLGNLRADVEALIQTGGSASRLSEVASALESVRRARTRIDTLREALGQR